ncbi:MAG: NAD-dependent epimerase/dehydratase family protein [Cyanobacteria bacterium]|nr:NAD-dependent epimerase/dehydratase family protein [Cyanobacteriota bacterium]MDW8200641.1 NAD-dependent epimerase/dehydratase family protein [Cyanobacteriota bacterium SKYGB_h_bin112]
MPVVLVTGSAGLVGSEAVCFFCDRGYTVVGIDNNLRQVFFGEEASTQWNCDRLRQTYPQQYIHHSVDIRDQAAIAALFQTYGSDITLIIHAAAQPSHDWAARDPYTDFTVNANGTLVLLENTRHYCPEAVFIFCSTNKVYGDTPNRLPLIEHDLRWEVDPTHPYHQGIDETMSLDQTQHSLFGASKLAADVLVQEYGRYFGLKTTVFRGGCLTGPSHAGTKLHGFLSYLMRCTVTGQPYQVYGYKGKQVRDNIHSYDLINAFYHVYLAPRVAEVYNIGGSRFSNCSMLEAIHLCEAIADRKLNWCYVDRNRIGDHIWWISDISKFQQHYPSWEFTYTIKDILGEIFTQNVGRW